MRIWGSLGLFNYSYMFFSKQFVHCIFTCGHQFMIRILLVKVQIFWFFQLFSKLVCI